MMSDAEKEQMELARAMIRAVYNDGEAEINGRVYKFTTMVHKKRRKVFAYFTKVMKNILTNDMSFLDTDEFNSVEEVINESVTFNDSLLSVIGDRHWELYPGDYTTFVTMALQVISYPFLDENNTG